MDNKQLFDKALLLLPYSASASQFVKFIINSTTNKDKLSDEIKTCSMDKLKIRFNTWRLLLGVCSIQNTIELKIKQLQLSRTAFKDKKDQAYRNVIQTVQKEVSTPKNPLMKTTTPLNNFHVPILPIQKDDTFIKDQIRKDVERTYQQIQFFQDKNILKLLNTILFIWCKKNPQISYQQGMNEVLASIVYVYFQEVYTTDRLPEGFEQLTEQQQNIYVQFNSIQYTQADIFNVFDKVMLIQHYMYKTQTDTSLKGVINPNSKNNTPILQRIITLIDQKLKSLDIELFRTIKLFSVQTKTFLLRWIRCMHTREFGLDCSFLIWDSIFLDYFQNPASKQKNQFEFIDAMCVAMFVYIRHLALNRQTTNQITQVYQKYPILKKGGYLQQLISLAWVISWQLRQTQKQTLELVLDQKTKKPSSKEKQQPSPNEKFKQTIKMKQKSSKQQPKQPNKKNSDNESSKDKPKQPNHKLLQPQLKPWRKQPQQQKQIIPEFNFSITLEPFQWQNLVKKLQKSLTNNIDEQSKSYIMEGIELVRAKVFLVQERKQ